MENNIIYWPSGWKDLTCPKKLPIVREEQVSAPPPVVSSAGTQRSAEELPTVDNTEMTNRRNQLRRQSRVARGLGEDLPPALPVLNTGPSFLAALSQNTQEMDISDSDNSKITVINRDDRFKETQIIVDNFPQFRKKSSSDNKRFQIDATRSENPPVDVHYSKTVATEKRLLELPLNREINSPSPSKVDITLRYMPLLKITEERPGTNQEIAVRRPLNNRTVRSSNTVNKHIYLPVEMPQNTNKMKELNYFDANVQNERRSNSKNAFSMKKSKTPDISNEDRIVVSVLELSPFENIEGQDTNSKMDVDTDEQVNKQQATDVSHTQNFAKPTLHKQFEAIRAKSKARTLLLNVLPSFHKTVSKDSAKEISSEDLFLRPERNISSGIRFPSVEKSQPMELIKESKSKRSYDRNIIQPVTKIHPRLKLDSTFVISRQKTYLVLKEMSHKIKDKPFGHISPRGMVKNDSPGKQMMIYKKASAVPTKRTDYVFPSDLNVEAGSNQVISHNESYIKEWSTEVLAINDTPRRRQSVASTSNQKSSHSTKLPLLNSSQSRQTNVSEKDPIEPLSIISTEIKPNSASDKRRAFNTEKDKPHEVKQQHRKKQISKLKPRRQHSFYLSEFQNNKNNVRSKQRKGKRRSIDYTSPNGSVSENTLVVQYGDKQHDENDFQAISKEEESLLFELSTVNHRDTSVSEVVRSESSTEPSTDSLLVDETSDQNMVTLRDVLSGIVDEKPKTECLPGLTSQTDQTDNNKRGSSNSECSLMLDDLMTKDIKRTGNFKSEDIENSDDFITDDILDKMANCNSMNFSENTLDPSSSSADRCHKQDNKTISNTSRLYEQTPSGKTTNSVIDFLHEQSDSADLDSSNTDHEDMDTDTPLNRSNNNITSSNEHSMNGTVGGKRAQTDDSSSPIYETDENVHKANTDVDNSYSDHEDMDTNTSLNNRSNSNITSSNEHRTNETVASKRSKTDDSSPINETDENVNKAHTDVDSSNSDHEDMDTSTTLNNYSNKNITSTNGTADDKRSKTDDSSSPINETDEMVHKAHTDVDSSNSDHEDMDTDTSLNNRSNKNITSTNEHSTTGTDDSSSPINKTDENIHTAHTDVKKIQTGVHDEEITAKPNTSPNTDTNHKQIHENPSDLKAVTNNNVDRDEVQLSLNSTTNLTSETIQIIQNTINEYGIDNASASSSFNKEDSQENDAKIMESTDSEMLDQTPTIEKTSDNELTNLTPNGTTGERVEHNAENDEDYMDSSALAANYVPYSLVRDATSSASLPGSPLEDEQDIIATISNMIQVSVWYVALVRFPQNLESIFYTHTHTQRRQSLSLYVAISMYTSIYPIILVIHPLIHDRTHARPPPPPPHTHRYIKMTDLLRNSC